jgi:hypothetical protein
MRTHLGFSAVSLQLRLLFRLLEVAEGMQFLHDTARVVHGEWWAGHLAVLTHEVAWTER